MRHPSELISAYLDGELNGGERDLFVGHVRSCGRCARELEEIQRIRTMVRSLPILELPGDLAALGDDEIVALRHNRGLWIGAAAAILVIVVAIATLLTPAPASLTVQDLNSRFGARASLDPAFGPAKVFAPGVQDVSE